MKTLSVLTDLLEHIVDRLNVPDVRLELCRIDESKFCLKISRYDPQTGASFVFREAIVKPYVDDLEDETEYQRVLFEEANKALGAG